jgi:predicted RNase H-like HicB family nuclease
MSPQEYLDSKGLGHLRAADGWSNRGPAALVKLAPGITLNFEPDTTDTYGGIWLDIDGHGPDGETPAEAEAALDRLAREADATATRYREALAVLRGEAPQPDAEAAQ